MSNLPFQKKKVWPKERKLAGVSKYGYSEDDELVEQASNEFMQAIESKDHKKLAEAIKALIHCVMAKEQGQDNEIDEKPVS
jgi:hypothetical protein